MAKRLISLFLLLAIALSVTSCAIVPVYDGLELEAIWTKNGYTYKRNDPSSMNEGILGYYYAYNPSADDEIYYIFCDDIFSTHSIYDYIDSSRKAKIAALKMEIDQIEYALYKAEDVSPSEKGRYYEKYVIKTEELAKIQNYDCGRGLNVVWYGTKQAIADLRKG